MRDQEEVGWEAILNQDSIPSGNIALIYNISMHSICTGSMRGSRIKEAKDTLLLFLKILPMGCYFNIIGFGSHFEVLFKK